MRPVCSAGRERCRARRPASLARDAQWSSGRRVSTAAAATFRRQRPRCFRPLRHRRVRRFLERGDASLDERRTWPQYRQIQSPPPRRSPRVGSTSRRRSARVDRPTGPFVPSGVRERSRVDAADSRGVRFRRRGYRASAGTTPARDSTIGRPTAASRQARST